MKIELNVDSLDFWAGITDRALKKIQATRQKRQEVFDKKKATRNWVQRLLASDMADSIQQTNITYMAIEVEDACHTIKDALSRNELFIHNDRLMPIKSISLNGDDYVELMNWAKPD